MIAHMPPSSADAFHDQVKLCIWKRWKQLTLNFWSQSNYFNQIVQRYQNTIVAQFYGHSHVVRRPQHIFVAWYSTLKQDEFAIAYSNYSNQVAATANNIAYIAPSLTPRSWSSIFECPSSIPVLINVYYHRCKPCFPHLRCWPRYVWNHGFPDLHKCVEFIYIYRGIKTILCTSIRWYVRCLIPNCA